MGGFGWHNPFPIEFGGGSTPTETIYAAMRSSVGAGGSAEDENGIDAIWRQARASALAAASTTGERAVIQAFPEHATDLLEYYEDLLAAPREEDATVLERQLVVATLYAQRVRSSVPDIEADLAAIDPRFEVIDAPHEQGTETLLGRGFEDLAATLPFNGGRKSTFFHNYSTDFVVFANFDIGSGFEPSIAELKLIELAKAHLNSVLAAHVMFQVSTAIGFILDESLLDLTGLNP